MRLLRAAITMLVAAIAVPAGGNAATLSRSDVRAIVAKTVGPLMRRDGVPGMAVGVAVSGHRYVFNFGVASRATKQPVDDATLFEVGSISKTFTATLACYAQLLGNLSLSGYASAYVPSLRGSSFDRITLVDLGTHTAGGLPLQLPDDVSSDDLAMNYYRKWKPDHAPGAYRLYSNPSIMLLGVATAASMHEDFASLVERDIFSKLGMDDSYYAVPSGQLANYAQGYTTAGIPVRLTLGPLADPAYGVRTTAGDLLRFVEANIEAPGGNEVLRRAIVATHTGYYSLGAMTQDLIWEQYRYPVALNDLLAGNSAKVILEPNPVVALKPPLTPRTKVLIDKTGSTRGFGAYVAFIPSEKIGIVLLANEAYDIPDRVAAAYRILAGLSE